MKRTANMGHSQPASSGTKRSKKQQQHAPPSPLLPEEMLGEIFSRLLAKSVGRFRCLSRSWAVSLSSASFIDLHHQQSNRQQQQQRSAGMPPNLFFTTAQRCLHAWRWRWRDDDGLPVMHRQTRATALSLLPQLDSDRALRVLTPKPCHGLVLLHRWPNHGHYVCKCNPSTGTLSCLPDSKIPSRMCWRYNYSLPGTYVNCVCYGLGYDPDAKEHKVVRLFYLNERGRTPTVTACEVYTIGGSQAGAHWRPAAQRAPSCTVRPWMAAVFFSGRHHFVQQLERGGHCNCIVTFDVCNETFGSLMPSSGLHNVAFELTVLDGCLCLHYGNDATSGDDTSFYIWRLSPPYHGHGAGQWEQLCCIRRQAWPEALLNLDWISPLEIYRGADGHKKILFATCTLTVFTLDIELNGDCAPETLLSPPIGDPAMDSSIGINSSSHTVGLLEECLVPVGLPSEEIIFSSLSNRAWSNVLKWLPTCSVVPLKRVCKDWCALIKSDRFIKLHTIHANMGLKTPQIKLISAVDALFTPLGRRELRQMELGAENVSSATRELMHRMHQLHVSR